MPVNISELFNSEKQKNKHNVEFLRKWLGYLLKINWFLGFVNLSLLIFKALYRINRCGLEELSDNIQKKGDESGTSSLLCV